MATNNYTRLIQLLSEGQSSFDWKALVYEIGSRHPKIIIDAIETIYPTKTWEPEARAMLRSGLAGSKLEAIKLCRSATGMTLKEAKEAVEALQ